MTREVPASGWAVFWTVLDVLLLVAVITVLVALILVLLQRLR